MAGYKLLNFLSLPNSYPYKYALIFFPYEKSTGFMKGTSKSWKEIIKQSHNIETYDFELGTNAVEKGISAFLISNKDDLKNVIEETKKHKAFNIFIGGEHTISYWSSNFFHFNTFFLFDAHADCMNLYKGKSLTHATWLRRLIEKKQKNIAFYISGLRIASKEEHLFLKRHNVKTSKSFIKLHNKDIYLSIDLDALDMSAMPCCSNPEVAGFSWHELINNIAYLIKNNNVVAVDIVEHRPIKGLEFYSYAVGWLIYKILCLKEKYG